MLELLIPAAAQAVFGAWQSLNAIKNAKKNPILPYGNWGLDTAMMNRDILSNTMGLPRAALDMFYNRQGQNQAAALQTLQSYNANPNLVAQVLQGGYRANEDITLQDALQRKQDIGNIINANTEIANQRDKIYALDLARRKDIAQALADQKTAGFTNIGGAINAATSGLAVGATNKLANAVMGMGSDSTNTTATPNSGVNTNQIMQDIIRGIIQGGIANNQSNTFFNQPTPVSKYNSSNYPYSNIPNDAIMQYLRQLFNQ